MKLTFPKGCTRAEGLRLSLAFMDRCAEQQAQKLENSLLERASENGWSAADIANVLDQARAEYLASRPDAVKQITDIFSEIVIH